MITPLSHLEIVVGILSIINDVRAGSQGNSLIYVPAAERLTPLDDQRGHVAFRKRSTSAPSKGANRKFLGLSEQGSGGSSKPKA